MFLNKTDVSRFAACLVLLMAACTPKPEGQEDPKRRLNEYISQGFAVRGPEDRGRLLSYLTGEAKTRLQSWSDEQFRAAFIDSKRQFVKLAFKEFKPVSPDEANITYELTYLAPYPNGEGETRDAKVVNRKLAQLVRKDGQWLITEVRSIREVVEYKDEMTVQAAKSSSGSR
jgi:hypothetical protein